jgi:5-methylcytosine-specific restriction protein A
MGNSEGLPGSRPGEYHIRYPNSLCVPVKLKTLPPRVRAMDANRVRTLPPPSKAPDYRIRGHKLQRIREHHLRLSPLCVHCEAHGLVTVAMEVDHIVPLSQGGPDTADNRQSLCLSCHRAKTDAELAAR